MRRHLTSTRLIWLTTLVLTWSCGETEPDNLRKKSVRQPQVTQNEESVFDLSGEEPSPTARLLSQTPVYFNGINSFLEFSDDYKISDKITITAQINVRTFGVWNGIVTKGEVKSPYAMLLGENNTLRFTANWGQPSNYQGRGSWDSTLTLQENKWHDVAIVYDGNVIKFYIDGILDDYQPQVSLKFGGRGTEKLIVGANFPGGNEYFHGKLANIEVYDVALTATEIENSFKEK